MHFKKLDSTSSFLKRNYQKFKNNTIVSASFQESGHGRMGRVWESREDENLMFSILIKDKKLIEQFDSISLLSAVSVLKTLMCFGATGLSIKWPNDVFIDSKKACGILLESISDENGIACLIVGIGINVNQEEFTLDTATSLFKNIGEKTDLKKFKKTMYNILLYELNELKEGNKEYLDVIRSYDYLKDKVVQAEIDGKEVTVKVGGINDDNSLKVYVSGRERNLRTGEISFHKNE